MKSFVKKFFGSLLIFCVIFVFISTNSKEVKAVDPPAVTFAIEVYDSMDSSNQKLATSPQLGDDIYAKVLITTTAGYWYRTFQTEVEFDSTILQFVNMDYEGAGPAGIMEGYDPDSMLASGYYSVSNNSSQVSNGANSSFSVGISSNQINTKRLYEGGIVEDLFCYIHFKVIQATNTSVSLSTNMNLYSCSWFTSSTSFNNCASSNIKRSTTKGEFSLTMATPSDKTAFSALSVGGADVLKLDATDTEKEFVNNEAMSLSITSKNTGVLAATAGLSGTINSITKSSGDGSYANNTITLEAGKTIILAISVTSQDSSVTNICKLSVYRMYGDAELSNLSFVANDSTLENNTLYTNQECTTSGFSTSTKNYYAKISSSTTAFDITATLNSTKKSKNLQISYNGGTKLDATSGTAKNITVKATANNKISIFVTSEDELTTVEYKITFVVLSDDAEITSLSAYSGLTETACNTSMTYTKSSDNYTYTGNSSVLYTNKFFGLIVQVSKNAKFKYSNGGAESDGTTTKKVFAYTDKMDAIVNQVITIIVTSESGKVTETYTFNANRKAANQITSISSISLIDNNNVTSTTSPAGKAYTINTKFLYQTSGLVKTTGFKFTVVLGDGTQAKYEYSLSSTFDSITEGVSGSRIANFINFDPDNVLEDTVTIYIKVIAQDTRVTDSEYTLIVKREAATTDATISSVSVTSYNNATALPAKEVKFDSSTKTYSVAFPYEVLTGSNLQKTTQFKFKVTLSDGNYATYKFDCSPRISLTDGTNNTLYGYYTFDATSVLVDSFTILLTCTAEDGDTTESYKLVVTRSAARTNSTLNGLEITTNNGITKNLTISSNTTDTEELVFQNANGLTTSFKIKAVLDDTYYSKYTFEYSGKSAVSGIHNLQNSTSILFSTTNYLLETVTLTIVVTAEDGVTKTTYTINVKREPANTNLSISDVVLKDNQNTEYSLNYDSTTFEYTISDNFVFENEKGFLTSFSITFKKGFEFQTFTYGGDANSSGVCAFTINNAADQKTLELKIVAQDTSTKTYKVIITRAAADQTNTISNLVGIGSENHLSYSATYGKDGYTIKVPTKAGSYITLGLEKDNAYQKIRIDGIDYSATTSYLSVSTLTMTVLSQLDRAENKAGTSYAIKVYIDDPKDGDNTIDDVSITMVGSTTNLFNYVSSQKTYTTTIPYSASPKVNVNVVKHSNLSVYVTTLITNATVITADTTNNILLNVGLNTICIQLKSESGVSGDKYTFEITVTAPDTNVGLTSFTINGSIVNLNTSNTSLQANYLRSVSETFNFAWELSSKVSTAKITCSNVAGLTSKTDLTAIALVPFGTFYTYTLEVKSEDGKTTANYQLTLYHSDTDSTVQGIEVVDNTGNNLVDLENKSYVFDVTNNSNQTLTIPYTVSSISFTFTNKNNYAVSYVNGIKASTAGTYTFKFSTTGTFEFTVYTLSEYATLNSSIIGNDTNAKSLEYKITIVRNPVNTENRLSDIKLTMKDSNNNDILFIGSTEALNTFSSDTFTYLLENITDSTGVVPTMVSVSFTKKYSNSIVSGDAGTKENVVVNIPLALATVNTVQSISINVSAENNTNAGTYSIQICRGAIDKNAECSILSITIDGNDGNTYYTSTASTLQLTTVQTITVPYNVTYVDYNVTRPIGTLSEIKYYCVVNSSPVSSTSRQTLADGRNQEWQIQVVAGDGAHRSILLRFEVTREAPSTDNTLSSLQVNGVDVANFAPTDASGTYNVTVDNSITEINLSATPNNDGTKLMIIANGSLVTNTEHIQVNQGTNLITITATAEDGTATTYSISVTRNSVTTLDNLEVVGQTISPEFSTSVSDYTCDVPYSVTNATINVELTISSATVKIENRTSKLISNTTSLSDTLAAGDNVFIVSIYNESGQLGNTYQVTITREAGDKNNYLATLEYGIGSTPDTYGSVPEFNKITNEYILVLPRTTTYISFKATAESELSTVTLPVSLSTTRGGLKTFEIVCTSQVNERNIYLVNVYCTDQEYEISNIEIMNNSNTSPILDVNSKAFEYDVETLEYTFTIPYQNVNTGIYFVVTPKSSYATVSGGTGYKSLVVGTNKFEYYATSEYGNVSQSDNTTSPTYIINVVVKEASSEARLNTLNIYLGSAIIDSVTGFTSDTYTVTISDVDSTVTSITIAATTIDANAKIITTLGTISLSSLSTSTDNGNTVIYEINVLAEDSTTRKTYKIVLSREVIVLNDNNNISNIDVIASDGINYLGSTIYSANTTSYSITLPHDVGIFTIFVTKEVETSLVNFSTGNGTYSVKKGETKNIIVYVVSEANTKGTEYTISVTRDDASSDWSLEWIKIDGEAITPFDPSILTYGDNKSIVVPFTVTSIDLTALTHDNNATILSGVGTNLQLAVGSVSYVIIVKAEDGTTGFYTVTVTRESESPLLTTLGVTGYNLLDSADSATAKKVSFDPNVTRYYVFVPYSVITVNIFATTDIANATISGIGPKNVLEGQNHGDVTISVPSGATTDYEIIIIRKGQMSVNTNATYIKIAEISEFESMYNNNQNIYYLDNIEQTSFTVSNKINKLNVSVLLENVGDSENNPATYIVLNDNLHVGENTLLVIITASDNETKRIVVVHVYRQQMVIDINENSDDRVTFTESESSEEYVYNLTLNKSDITKINYSNFISCDDDAEILIISDVNEDSNEVVVKITDGDETVLVRFNLNAKTNGFLEVLEGNIYTIGIFAGCALILLLILISVNRDKFGKVITKSKKRQNNKD